MDHILRTFYNKGKYNFYSPLELLLHRQLWDIGLEARENYEVHGYRIDLAFPEKKLAIEIDGFEFHTGVKQKENDAKRQANLEALGWHFERFDGWFIHRHADVAAAEMALKHFKECIRPEFKEMCIKRIAHFFEDRDPDLSERLYEEATNAGK
jgi:very-short-patch-repair endonuclease